MYDVVSLYLSDEMVRYVVVWTIAVSALMVFVMAFAVTRGAGFGCPLALLRGAQRVFLCALAISLAYVGAFIAEYAADAVRTVADPVPLLHDVDVDLRNPSPAGPGGRHRQHLGRYLALSSGEGAERVARSGAAAYGAARAAAGGFLALPSPSLGVSSLDLGRSPGRLFSCVDGPGPVG